MSPFIAYFTLTLLQGGTHQLFVPLRLWRAMALSLVCSMMAACSDAVDFASPQPYRNPIPNEALRISLGRPTYSQDLMSLMSLISHRLGPVLKG
jgi:hypothetical protein